MDDKKSRQTWHEINTDDYNAMRAMISDIERNLIGVDPKRQREFYMPLRNMIMEAWYDSRNSDDSFLFKPSDK